MYVCVADMAIEVGVWEADVCVCVPVPYSTRTRARKLLAFAYGNVIYS